jgi:hypothetical protein
MNTFLTGRNQFDAQISAQEWLPGTCEAIIEAAARRMVAVEGAYTTAVRLQRLADIAAAIDVKPIEHWTAPARHETVDACLEPEDDAPAPQPLIVRLWNSYGAAFAYLIGVAVGMGFAP